MTPELEAFLAAEDLDELLRARNKIAAVDAEDEAVIRAVIGAWQNAQAVSNLMFHPDLIPADLRLPTLFRGLGERQVGYYVLAAVVGFQSLDAGALNESDCRQALFNLLAVMRDTTGILATRASVSFQGFAKPDDAGLVMLLLDHSEKTVRHNIRAWLFRTFQEPGVEPLAAEARASGMDEELRTQLIAEFTDFLAGPREGYKSPLFSLFGYIPNLRDARR